MPNLPTPDRIYARYPDNLGLPPVDKWMLFEVKSGRHVVRNVVADDHNVDRTIASVGLYLAPTALQDRLAVEYDKNELGPFIGTAVELLARTGQNLFDIKLGQVGTDRGTGFQALIDGVTKGTRQAADNIGDAIRDGRLSDAYGDMLKADAAKGLDNLASFLGAEGGVSTAILGQKVNPRTDIQFGTQMYREHAYSFELVPRNLNEAKQIDRIVNFFQFYSLPTYRANETSNTVAFGSFMMGFPYDFEISFLDGSARPLNHVNKVARSVCKNVEVNHAAGGKTAFIKENGEYYPVMTKLELHFQETKLLARDSPEIQRANGIDPTSDSFDPRK